VARLSLGTFHDLAVLLASLAPVTLFLGLTVERPRSEAALGEYPLFLGLQVGIIALAGTVALVRQAAGLFRRHRLGLARSAAVTISWLAISLVAGGQAAWYLRPWFGLAFMKDLPFLEGARPDFRGATSFFEAVLHLVSPP
jgi:hypothetical protein